MAPEGWLKNCKGVISKAHTVPKSGSLKRIARKGHVYNLTTEPSYKHTGNQLNHIPRLLGINKASTFNGFCTQHDQSIFEPVEKDVFRGTSQQCFLLGYRALAMEMYKKHALFRSLDYVLQADEVGKFQQQYELDAYKNAFEASVRTALKISAIINLSTIPFWISGTTTKYAHTSSSSKIHNPLCVAGFPIQNMTLWATNYKMLQILLIL